MSNTKNKTARIYIGGMVQNVGFRHFIRSKANELSLTGWVQNLPDGRVEALVQGSKENIEQLIKHCKKGTFLSEVENVDVQWDPSASSGQEFTTFDIL